MRLCGITVEGLPGAATERSARGRVGQPRPALHSDTKRVVEFMTVEAEAAAYRDNAR